MLMEVGWKQICLIESGVVFLFYLIAKISFSPLYFYGASIYSLESNNPLSCRMFLTAACYRQASRNSWELFQVIYLQTDCTHVRTDAFSSALCNKQKTKAGTQVAFV